MEHHVGLDVSLKLTAICTVDRTGKIEREGVVSSDPEAIAIFIKSHAPHVRRPDNRFNYLEVSGVPVHPASQSRSRQRYWFLDCPDLSLGEVCRLLRLRSAFTSSMDFV